MIIIEALKTDSDAIIREYLTCDLTYSENISENPHQMVGPTFRNIDLSFPMKILLDWQTCQAYGSFRVSIRLDSFYTIGQFIDKSRIQNPNI